MNEIHDSKLSSKENKELEEFALNHPYTKVVELIQNTDKISYDSFIF
jgi:hypothetical protein